MFAPASTPLSTDHWIRIWNAAGTWLAGIGTIAAVFLSHFLARASRRVHVKADVGIMRYFPGNGPAIEVVTFEVANGADRAVTITEVGWKVGKGKDSDMGFMIVSNVMEQLPMLLNHAQSAHSSGLPRCWTSWATGRCRRCVAT
ncbi:hypothetical protein [Variovorax saccharolyticus]|uniref:hypothetical protein n=1 Tax=Variovorax saccharolyticus TaxID=3053516 RepID=UPI002579037E|nr:hypothetical protein [Variovorax sp. J31P216]MDM0029827.1 hypothetical protein [Variovorax sp. J31P216]